MSASRKSAAAKPKAKNQNRDQKSGQARPRKKNDEAAATPPSDLPLELHQLLLSIFQNTFPARFGEDLNSVLQEVKGHLYRRDFAAAFGRDDYLQAYAVRWSPSRALGYSRILHLLFKEYLEGPGAGDDARRDTKIACLGGGAGAEIVALAGVMKARTQDDLADRVEQLELDDQKQETGPIFENGKVTATFVDVANWKSVIAALHQGIIDPTPLSVYASAAAKAANRSVLSPGSFEASFRQMDLLAISGEELRAVVGCKHLITIFFTLNELYTTSLPKTQAFLLQLTSKVDKGTLLLVVDSAGSYSTVRVNEKEKKYPMHWLLDHALLKPGSSSAGSKDSISENAPASLQWEKLQEVESEWFRVPEGLKYPLELENMRYQLHLYRRL